MPETQPTTDTMLPGDPSSGDPDGVVPTPHPAFPNVTAVEHALRAHDYLPEHGLAVAIFLAMGMRRPLLLEGEPGVGKTEVAKTVARILGVDLIRLQCYEGIDASQALYEWDYARQLLHVRSQSDLPHEDKRDVDLFGPEFLLERPILASVRRGASAVLLIDELDRADDEFDAFLLEVLSEQALTIPEIGTISAPSPPIVFITSNRTRELHDALKRRCFYHWIDYPPPEREAEIIRTRVPSVEPELARAIASAVTGLRELGLVKQPGIAEAIDWALATSLMGGPNFDPAIADQTVGAAIKNREDLARVTELLPDLYTHPGP